MFTLPVNFLPNGRLATSPIRSRIGQIPFSQLFGTLKRNLHALVKYQFQPMFLLCQVLPTRSIPCGHVVNSLRTFLIFTSELRWKTRATRKFASNSQSRMYQHWWYQNLTIGWSWLGGKKLLASCDGSRTSS